MKLEEFLTKWEWLDLKDADETLTESEQKIWEFMEKNAQLGEKDKRIKVLDKALELACLELMQDLKFESKDDKHYTLCENIEYFKVMARKELGNE